MMLSEEQERILNRVTKGWTIEKIESGGNCFTLHLSRGVLGTPVPPEIRRVVIGRGPDGWITGVLHGISENS